MANQCVGSGFGGPAVFSSHPFCFARIIIDHMPGCMFQEMFSSNQWDFQAVKSTTTGTAHVTWYTHNSRRGGRGERSGWESGGFYIAFTIPILAFCVFLVGLQTFQAGEWDKDELCWWGFPFNIDSVLKGFVVEVRALAVAVVKKMGWWGGEGCWMLMQGFLSFVRHAMFHHHNNNAD